MSAKELTEAQQQSRTAARQRIKEQRDQPRAALEDNQQFRHYKFLKSMDAELLDEVESALPLQRARNSDEQERLRRIKELEAELAELKTG